MLCHIFLKKFWALSYCAFDFRWEVHVLWIKIAAL